jgi:hypothetical protein
MAEAGRLTIERSTVVEARRKTGSRLAQARIWPK